jgi:hypothetical protein
MEQLIDSGNGKVVYNDYITVIKNYLIPFFGNYHLNTIGYDELQKFNTWRLAKMKRAPVLSTVTTHNSALNRVFQLALERGWIAQTQIPKLKNNGKKGTAREAFSLSEYKSLTSYMPHWVDKGHTAKTNQMRDLLRDYILVLSNTGIRHGTEALGLKWRDIEWITQKNGERYLQFTVKGKTGKRQLGNTITCGESSNQKRKKSSEEEFTMIATFQASFRRPSTFEVEYTFERGRILLHGPGNCPSEMTVYEYEQPFGPVFRETKITFPLPILSDAVLRYGQSNYPRAEGFAYVIDEIEKCMAEKGVPGRRDGRRMNGRCLDLTENTVEEQLVTVGTFFVL